MVNLKLRGTLPLVEGTRLLALKAGIPATSTLARLAALKERGALNAADHDDLAGAFQHITHLLLRQQLEDFRAGEGGQQLRSRAPVTTRKEASAGLLPRNRELARDAKNGILQQPTLAQSPVTSISSAFGFGFGGGRTEPVR